MKRAPSHPSVERATRLLGSAKREAEQLAQADLARRQAASTILHPNEVSGEYDAGRLLTTTLRGAERPLTHDDLRAFSRNVSKVKKQFKAGITAQAVIDLSLPADRERANTQIKMAVPVSLIGGRVHFITNAGPDSDRSRHHVHVEFLDFQAAVAASPNDQKKIGRMVAKGRLAFDCDCGRHTYWYRYIATIGKYNFGRAETGFPKIRNPKLHGVACKHVLRVMHIIQRDGNVQGKIAAQVLKAREVLDGKKLKAEKVKVAELRAMADEQHKKRRSTTNLKTSDHKAAAAALRKAKADMKKVAIDKAKPAAAKTSSSVRDKRIEKNARSLLDLGAITQQQYDQIVQGTK
ncbi:hypothetical protein [Burkholderia gladioli]|uniref:hypothetical protein n=1 Tax=Burkholderia gladioli TaxID=28095 RepID=UPI001640A25A|nr:hypothetical protein [Burkholderia gladioli]